MKKSYETPSIEVVKFQYRDQVVVASGNGGSYICGIKHDYNAAGKGNDACITNSEWLTDHE